MNNDELKEFLPKLAQYVQETGQVVYGDGKTWSTNSNGQEKTRAMIVNIESIECRHVYPKTYVKDFDFACSNCGKTLTIKEFKEK